MESKLVVKGFYDESLLNTLWTVNRKTTKGRSNFNGRLFKEKYYPLEF